MAGRLGKGLGALFPSINPQNSRDDKGSSLTDLHTTPHQEGKHESVSQSTKAQNSQDSKGAQSSQIVQGGQKRGKSNHKTQATSQEGQHSQTPRIPSWDEIAHPVDLFFGDSGTIPPKKRSSHPSDSVRTIPGSTQGGVAQFRNNVSRETLQRREKDNTPKPVKGAYLTQIPVNDIVPNPKQPRKVFDKTELRELADSIKEVGVLQPIVVTKSALSAEQGHAAASQQSHQRFELVMGERRWRACRIAGLVKIPAIVRTATSEQMLRDALLENLQRVQLNPLEEAAAYQQMMQEFGLTQERLSQAISKSRPQIANTLRLLQLPPSIQKLVASNVLSAGHARALLTLKNKNQMAELANRIVKEGLSVRSTEEIVALQNKNKSHRHHKSNQLSADYWAGTGLPNRLEERLQTKVSIRGNEQRGRIVISFSSHQDLDRIAHLLSEGSNSSSTGDGWV